MHLEIEIVLLRAQHKITFELIINLSRTEKENALKIKKRILISVINFSKNV